MSALTLMQWRCDHSSCRATIHAPTDQIHGKARRAGWTAFTSPTTGHRYHRCPAHPPRHLRPTEETP